MEYFRYHNTNCYFLKSKNNDKLLAIDAGWPGTIREYQRALKSIGYRFDQIAWAVVTHFHMDHAGLVGEFVESDIKCYVFEYQKSAIDDMERIIRKNDKEYRSINKEKLLEAQISESRYILDQMGILGEIISTNGHSSDSITIITDDHEAIIGDLAPLNQIMSDDEKSQASWKKIREKGARYIFPSHAQRFEL